MKWVDWNGFEKQTFWELMKLIIVPVLLAVGAYRLNLSPLSLCWNWGVVQLSRCAEPDTWFYRPAMNIGQPDELGWFVFLQIDASSEYIERHIGILSALQIIPALQFDLTELWVLDAMRNASWEQEA